MKNYEALELQAKAMRLVEGTGLNWNEVIRLHSRIIYNGRYDLNGYKPGDCELALTIVEGKPVFNGDVLYTKINGCTHTIDQYNYDFANYSWNPPKPKTVLVEMLVVDAEVMVSTFSCFEDAEYAVGRVSASCRKALGELK
jgi:hypothetical protein